ncbi:MAG: alpha/beta hydrolase [Armatimonadetes bacterium]|nr:alpha/beta hydrolase [Anaerolineae bacterium]
MLLSEHTVSVNGYAVHYWQAGDPQHRPVVLLHGMFGDAYTQWAEVILLLAEDYYVLAPDLPGFGQSVPLPDMSLPALLEWLQALYAALTLDSAVVIGSAFGALLGRLLAADSPALVPALVMVNGGVIPQSPALAKFVARLPLVGGVLFQRIAARTSQRSALEDALHQTSVLTPALMAQIDANRGGLARLMRALTLSPIPAAQTPAVPVLLLWGESDGISPPKVAAYIAKSIPGARQSIIAETGHLPHVEAPEVFVAQVNLFLNQLNRGRRGAGVAPLKL